MEKPAPRRGGEEVLLILCDETKRSRLAEYLASPGFGCTSIAPTDFMHEHAINLVKPEAKNKKRKKRRPAMSSVSLLFLRLPDDDREATTTTPSNDAMSLRSPSRAFVEWIQEHVLHHPFLYRYAKSFYVATSSSYTLDFVQEVAREAMATNKVLRLSTYPKNMTPKLIDMLPEEVQLHPKNFTHLFFVVKEKGRYYYSLAPKDLFWCPETGVHSIQAGQVSRAYHKIKEVFTRIECLAQADTSQWTAIDVGAAPGGWTQFMSPIMRRVISIDPGELHIDIPPNVLHFQKKVEDCKVALQEFAPVDLLACDMNMCEALQAIQAMQPLAPLLRPEGFLVMTWKLPKRLDENLDAKTEALQTSFMHHFPDFEIVQVLWLLANMYERTVIARKRRNGNRSQ